MYNNWMHGYRNLFFGMIERTIGLHVMTYGRRAIARIMALFVSGHSELVYPRTLANVGGLYSLALLVDPDVLHFPVFKQQPLKQ